MTPWRTQRGRRTGKIDRLDRQTKDEVEQMLLSGVTYREIVEFLRAKGITLSEMAVCTYAKKFLATTQMLRIAQENFRMLTDELDKHPGAAAMQDVNALIFQAMARENPGLYEQVRRFLNSKKDEIESGTGRG